MVKDCTVEEGIREVCASNINVAEVCTREVLTFEGASSEILTGEILGHEEGQKMLANFSTGVAQKLPEWVCDRLNSLGTNGTFVNEITLWGVSDRITDYQSDYLCAIRSKSMHLPLPLLPHLLVTGGWDSFKPAVS